MKYFLTFIITFVLIFAGIRLAIKLDDKAEQTQETEITYSLPNTAEGTVTILKPTGEECYGGLIRIDVDGSMIRVLLMDAVESDFADNF